MKIEKYLPYMEEIQEYRTYTEYKCPVCNSEGFKVDKTTYAYKNFKCECSLTDIHANLYSRVGVFVIPQKKKELVVETIVNPVQLPNKCRLCNLTTVKLPEVQEKWNSRYGDYIETTYKYAEDKHLIRIDYEECGKKHKKCFPKIYQENCWLFSKGNDRWNVFIAGEISKNGNSIFSVEGEKSVIELAKNEVAAFSIPGIAWTDSEIRLAIKDFMKTNSHIETIVHIPDNDLVGQKKSKMIRNNAWKLGLSFIQVDWDNLWKDIPDSGDVVEYLNFSSIQNLKQHIEYG